ncbi:MULTISPECIES: type IV toxin-antitoxin system AbiEi family antitoxin [unclassified Massilia]|uniref:type IV toxin-antitoxin system AbiEi family antitoxin n=1 Tax=unclassified Massilia TaxID=2609279 RepID=UPI0017840D20|nr:MULTISPECIES: type IV toxin-antitoxin system AbiEi family antitoxin [unclassified Massilia]MBD8533196.1 hypothetical protein [Massilia sp. CFBP 13647]MBD8676651.1 hypothetical protein [Massilia sp. CFBP 13721]
MNARHDVKASSPEAQLIEASLQGLHASTGIEGKLVGMIGTRGRRVRLRVAGQSLQYGYEVKQVVDRFSTLDDLKARSVLDEATLLFCPVLTDALAIRCHSLGIQFIDTAGNAYITDGAGILISVTGRKLDKASRHLQARDAGMTPAMLRVLFGALAEPAMLNAPYREISNAVQVSTGAIAKAFEGLEARGFITVTPDGTRLIRSPELAVSEWATGYLHRLRPKLRKIRFASDRADELRKTWSPGYRESAWSGEVAAESITQHLNPSSYTIYMDLDSEVKDLIKTYRLRADPTGNIEIIQPFWNMDRFADSFPTVPWHLVYADLLETQDGRNLAVADQIFKKVVAHVHDSQRQTA